MTAWATRGITRGRHAVASLMQRLADKTLSAEQKDVILRRLPCGVRDPLMEMVEPGYRQRIERQKACIRIGAIETKLFDLGLVDPALAELRDIAMHGARDYDRREAAWVLAKWAAIQDGDGSREECLRWLAIAGSGELDARRLCLLAIAEAECMTALGDPAAAHDRLSRRMKEDDSIDLLLASANLLDSPDDKIGILNAVLSRSGLSPIKLTPRNDIPAFDRLRGTAFAGRTRLTVTGGPTVTVIVTAYNAATTIRTAINSLRAQTWPFLEMIAVDDGSADETPRILHEYAACDPRIRVLAFPENRGTYVCRNEALMRATGEFVTCHDADDWSHPEKIERQVRHLMATPELAATTSLMARAGDNLNFVRPMLSSRYAIDNFSSLMFRRQRVQAKIGYWDSVRFACDGEFIRRIERCFGAGTVGCLSETMLAIARKTNSSLTGCAKFGMSHSFMGARREYVEASEAYYRRTRDCARGFPLLSRPFPVPEPMWPFREKSSSTGARWFNVIVASDLRLVKATSLFMDRITAWRDQGLRCGLIQIPTYAVDPDQPVDGAVRDVVDGQYVQVVVFGERVACDLLLLSSPSVLKFRNRFLPEVQAVRTCVVCSGDFQNECGGDIESCRVNVEEWVGKFDVVTAADVRLNILRSGEGEAQ